MTIRIERGFVNCFGQGGMRVDGRMDIINGRFHRNCETHLSDQVGRILTNDMRAENLAVLFAKEEFCEAFGLAASLCLTKCLVGELTDLVLDTLCLKCAFGLTNRSDLRIRVGAAWEDVDLADLVTFDKHAFDALHCFEAGGVGEPWGTCDVADGVDVRDGGLVAVVDLDPAAVGEFGLLSSRKNRDDTDRDEAGIGGDLLRAIGVFNRDGD